MIIGIIRAVLSFSFVLSASEMVAARCKDKAAAGVDWARCNVQMIHLEDVDLSGANLAGAFVSGTVLEGSKLAGANLVSLRGGGASLRHNKTASI